MNTKEIRKHFILTQKDISEIFSIPLRTIQNWDYRNNMPEYLGKLIYAYLSDMYYQYAKGEGDANTFIGYMKAYYTNYFKELKHIINIYFEGNIYIGCIGGTDEMFERINNKNYFYQYLLTDKNNLYLCYYNVDKNINLDEIDYIHPDIFEIVTDEKWKSDAIYAYF